MRGLSGPLVKSITTQAAATDLIRFGPFPAGDVVEQAVLWLGDQSGMAVSTVTLQFFLAGTPVDATGDLSTAFALTESFDVMPVMPSVPIYPVLAPVPLAWTFESTYSYLLLQVTYNALAGGLNGYVGLAMSSNHTLRKKRRRFFRKG